jgi:hypothetical protein
MNPKQKITFGAGEAEQALGWDTCDIYTTVPFRQGFIPML